MSTTSSTSIPVNPKELPAILLVEDEPTPRRELSRALTRKGFNVREAASGEEAMRQAGAGDVGLVLMDILLGDGQDGIEAAQEIQQAHPETSVVFVSAYAKEPEYHQRAEGNVFHIGGWIEKPIKIPETLQIVSRELVKVRLRLQLQQIRAAGGNPVERLDELARHDSSVSPEIVEELRQELLGVDADIHQPLLQSSEEVEMEIDAVYDEIRSLVASRAGDPGLSRALHPLREKLRALQEREAEMMERRFLAHFRFDPEGGDRLIERAQQLLKKRR